MLYHFPKMTSYLVCILFAYITSPVAADLIDLEEGGQDFILETKRISIPGYPHAFNASIVRWHGRLLLSFRIIPDRSSSFTSQLGLVWLDDNFNPMGQAHILNTRDLASRVPSRAEDARLITKGDRLYIVYDDNAEMKISKGGFRMYYGEVLYNGQSFSIHRPICLSEFEGESRAVREKGWVPFIYDDQLLLAYSLLPHFIFYPIPGTSRCETVAISHSSLSWNWGTLRGGTPALQGVAENEEYLSFFHSSKDMESQHSNGKKAAHYFIGAYTFAKDPPFAITRMSPTPIIAKGFYSGQAYKPYWKPIMAVFPCGYVFDERYIWIAYGRQDHEIWIAKLCKKGLLKSLMPVIINKTL